MPNSRESCNVLFLFHVVSACACWRVCTWAGPDVCGRTCSHSDMLLMVFTSGTRTIVRNDICRNRCNKLCTRIIVSLKSFPLSNHSLSRIIPFLESFPHSNPIIPSLESFPPSIHSLSRFIPSLESFPPSLESRPASNHLSDRAPTNKICCRAPLV